MLKKTFKIILFLFLLIVIALYYFVYTPSGKQQGYSIISFVLSEKNHLHIKLIDLNLKSYPKMSTEILIEKKYTLKIAGVYEDKKLDMHYSITSNCLESNICSIKDDVNITGTIKGKVHHATILGEGHALDGHIRYQGIKQRHGVRDVNASFADINASKLFRLLGQNPIFKGKANAQLNISHLNKKQRRGTLSYSVHDKDYHGLDTEVKIHISTQDTIHNFFIHVKSPTAEVSLVDGIYNRETQIAHGTYIVDIKEASDLEELLHLSYQGAVYSTGEIDYSKKEGVLIRGFSKSFGGVLDLVYKERKLHFYLDNVPLSPLFEKFSTTSVLDSNLTGKGIYNFLTKNVQFDANLSDVRFKKSSLTQSIYEKSHINLATEVFTHNTFKLRTIEETLSSTLSLNNTNNHLKFANTIINSKNHSVQSTVDLKLAKYALKGDLFVKIDKYTSANDTYIRYDGIVQKHYALKLNGLINNKWASVDYALSAARLPSHICTIIDDVNLTGHVSGPLKRLNIEGKGIALDGRVQYRAVKRSHTFEDINIKMHNIHAKKLSTLLGHPDLPAGKVDLEADFRLFSEGSKKGKLHYTLKNATLYDLPFTLDSHIVLNDDRHDFTANISLADAKLTLDKGFFYLKSNEAQAFYTLKIEDIRTLKSLLGTKVKGPFYAVGTVNYHNQFIIHGLSKTFDGLTEFNYENDKIDINLSQVSFKNVMNIFSYPLLLDATTTAKIHYDLNTEDIRIKADLIDAKFIYSDTIEDIYQKSGINLLKETFDRSTLDLKYHDKIINGNLILDNDESHLSLTNARIDTNLNTINGFFDINMQQQAFTGKVYGSLDDPKLNLNMQKLIRHEMDKQLDTFVGEGNRKMMESMPMGDAAKDMASGMGGAFMGIFF